MFAPETYKPTYQGPFLATGESLRRARNDAQAAGDSKAIARAYARPMKGIAAGGPMSALRESLMADTQATQSRADGMDAYNQLAQQNAKNNLSFQVGQAQEMARLASLLLGKREADDASKSARLDRESSQRVFSREMEVNEEIRRRQEEAAKRKMALGILTGLVTGVGFGNPYGFAQAARGLGGIA